MSKIIKPYTPLKCLQKLTDDVESKKPNRIEFTYNDHNNIDSITTYTLKDEGGYDPCRFNVLVYSDEGILKNMRNCDVRGYSKISDISTDLPLVGGAYYNVIDFSGNKYLVLVDYNLEIADNEVIKDVSGYVRLQGVEMPCMVSIKNIASVSNTTEGVVYMEIESNFENRRLNYSR